MNFTDVVLYAEQTGLQSGGSERVNSVWCQTPLLYLQATAVDTQGPTVTSISLTLLLQYLPFYSGTLNETHLVSFISLVTHDAFFFSKDKVYCWELTFTISSYIFYSSNCVYLERNMSA